MTAHPKRATKAPTNGQARLRVMSDLLADVWAPAPGRAFVARGSQPWDEFFPVGTARQFNLGRGRRVIAVRTSRTTAMLSGRALAVEKLEFPSKPCVSKAKRERKAS